MSNPGKIPNPFTTLVVTGNPATDAKIRYGLFGLFVFLLGVMGGWLNAHGFHDPNIYVFYLPTGLALGLSSGALALWGIVRSSKLEILVQLREALGVQAGINLVASGNAVDANGTVVDRVNGETPPKPVTVASSQEIIKNFAPAPADIAKS